MPSDLLAASARLRKFHGLTGGSSKWHSSAHISAHDITTALAPRRATRAAAGVINTHAAEDDEALARLQRRVQGLGAATAASLHSGDGAYRALRLDGPGSAAGVPAASPAARPHVVVGGRHRSDLTRGISPLRCVKAAGVSEDALASPLARALADFGGREGCTSAQASTAPRRNYASAAHEPMPDAGSSSWRNSGASRQGSRGAGDYFQSLEGRAQEQAPFDARALAAASASVSVSAVRSTYRRRKREVVTCVRMSLARPTGHLPPSLLQP